MQVVPVPLAIVPSLSLSLPWSSFSFTSPSHPYSSVVARIRSLDSFFARPINHRLAGVSWCLFSSALIYGCALLQMRMGHRRPLFGVRGGSKLAVTLLDKRHVATFLRYWET